MAVFAQAGLRRRGGAYVFADEEGERWRRELVARVPSSRSGPCPMAPGKNPGQSPNVPILATPPPRESLHRLSPLFLPLDQDEHPWRDELLPTGPLRRTFWKAGASQRTPAPAPQSPAPVQTRVGRIVSVPRHTRPTRASKFGRRNSTLPIRATRGKDQTVLQARVLRPAKHGWLPTRSSAFKQFRSSLIVAGSVQACTVCCPSGPARRLAVPLRHRIRSQA